MVLTEEKKASMLKALSELDDKHWEEVRKQVDEENKSFRLAREALKCGPEKLKQVYDI